MRDYETMQVAMTAAETGHLIFSTLHTIGAANTIDRIIDVFPPNQQRQICLLYTSKAVRVFLFFCYHIILFNLDYFNSKFFVYYDRFKYYIFH